MGSEKSKKGAKSYPLEHFTPREMIQIYRNMAQVMRAKNIWRKQVKSRVWHEIEEVWSEDEKFMWYVMKEDIFKYVMIKMWFLEEQGAKKGQ